MRIFLLAGAALALAAQVAAAADLCAGGPRDQWLSKEQVAEKMAALGHQAYELAVEDGCIEVIVTANGQHLEYYLEPLTGEVVKVEED